MELNTENLTERNRIAGKVLYAAVTPRPIAWVSTVSEAGIPNLAPYSFFNAASSHPPTVVFSVGNRPEPNIKDTLANIRANGEFVVNFVTEETGDPMNITAVEVPNEVNEFERAGLTEVPSTLISPPRVAESPISFECRLLQLVPIHEEHGGSTLVIGTVVMMHVDDSIYDPERGYIVFDGYKVIGRMAGNNYVRTRDQFELIRPASELKK